MLNRLRSAWDFDAMPPTEDAQYRTTLRWTAGDASFYQDQVAAADEVRGVRVGSSGDAWSRRDGDVTLVPTIDSQRLC